MYIAFYTNITIYVCWNIVIHSNISIEDVNALLISYVLSQVKDILPIP